MQKIVLKNGKTIDVLSVNENQFSFEATPEKMVEVFNELTDKALSKIEVQNEDGGVIATIVNKDKSSCSYDSGVATIGLVTVNTIEARLTELEIAFDELAMALMSDNDLEVEEE